MPLVLAKNGDGNDSYQPSGSPDQAAVIAVEKAWDSPLHSRRNCRYHERHKFLCLRCDQRRRIRGIHLETKIPKACEKLCVFFCVSPKLDLQNFRTPTVRSNKVHIPNLQFLKNLPCCFFFTCFLPPSKPSSKKSMKASISGSPTEFLTGGLLVASNSQGFISALAMAAVMASRMDDVLVCHLCGKRPMSWFRMRGP